MSWGPSERSLTTDELFQLMLSWDRRWSRAAGKTARATRPRPAPARAPKALRNGGRRRKRAYQLRELERRLRDVGIELPEDLPRGCVVATARLGIVRPTEDFSTVPNAGLWWYYDLDARKEVRCGDFSAGRFAWVLDQVVALDPPVPATGARGLWRWDYMDPPPEPPLGLSDLVEMAGRPDA